MTPAVEVEVRRNRHGSVLAYADRDRASRLLADHRAVLHALYDLVDRRHGADGETVARLVVREDERIVDELELRDRFRRDLDADRAISLVEDLRYHAGERELVTDGGRVRSEEEIDYPDMPVPAVDAALHSAHAIVTSPVYAHTFPDGEVNEDYPIKEGGWWDQFTTCLDGRWEAIKAEAETFDDREADGQTRLVTDGGSEKHTDDFGGRDDLARVADALELQNALLLQLVQDQECERCQQRHDPDDTGRSDRATATDVVDAYGDLYGGSVAGWEFDPVSERVEDMGGSR